MRPAGSCKHHVKNLVPGPRTCTPNKPGIYEYSATWTPATWDNKPWLGGHIVNAHNCSAGPVSCTASRCTVKITGCRTGQPGTWIAVAADVGLPGGGKVPAAPPSRCL